MYLFGIICFPWFLVKFQYNVLGISFVRVLFRLKEQSERIRNKHLNIKFCQETDGNSTETNLMPVKGFIWLQ